MAQAGFTPIQLYRTTTASAQPSAGNLAAGELAINLTDKKLYAKDASNNVFLLADASSGGTTATNLAGGAAGSLPYQSGANATTFLGIGAANRVLTSSGTAPQWVTSLTGLTGVSSSSMTNTSLTSGRLVYSTTGGAQTDSANLTFDGTSLTLGGNPTLSAGTANGVLYLNGSKVATSGSALTFDGGILTVPQLRTTNAVGAIFNTATGAYAQWQYNATAVGDIGTANNVIGGGATTDFAITSRGASGNLVFGINTAEQMRLTSTGLGIGTTPISKLQSLTAVSALTSNAGFSSLPLTLSDSTALAADTGGGINFNAIINSGGGYNSIAAIKAGRTVATGADYRGYLAFYTGDNGVGYPLERMRLDAAGNFGIGTTNPSAYGKLAVVGAGVTGHFDSTSGAGGVTFYESTTGRGGIRTLNGSNGLAFLYGTTPGMTLDSSGNLGLGVTPSAWNTSFYTALQAGVGASLFGSKSNAAAAWVGANTFFNSSNNSTYIDTAAATQYRQLNGEHAWYTAPSGTAGNAISFTQALTLHASGGMSLGNTTDPGAYILSVGPKDTSGNDAEIRIDGGSSAGGEAILSLRRNGASNLLLVSDGTANEIRGVANVPLTFRTNDQERARITSGGALLINRTGLQTGITDGCRLQVLGTSPDWTGAFENSHATTPYGVRIKYSAASPNGTGSEFILFDDSTTTRATIRSNGGLANYQSNNVDLSDARTKKDIAPAPSYWSKIGALEIVTYKYKDQTHDDINVGVIAQQVEQVEPVWVDADGFGEAPEGEEPLKTVYTKDITFAAIKALQEAMLRIEALEAKVAALETH